MKEITPSKEFLSFFSIGSLSLLLVISIYFLVIPDKGVLSQINELINFDNKFFFLFLLFSLPLIYTLGAMLITDGEYIISGFFNSISETELIKAIKEGKFNTEVEDNLTIQDFINASKENTWTVQSNRFYQYSIFFAGVFRAISASYLFLLLVILLIYLPLLQQKKIIFIITIIIVLLALFFELSLRYLIPKHKETIVAFFELSLRYLIPKYLVPKIKEIKKETIVVLVITTTMGLLNTFYLILPYIIVFIILSQAPNISHLILIIILTLLISTYSFYLSLIFRRKANAFLILGATSNKLSSN